MTPQDALKLLDEIAQQARLTRAEHARIKAAYNILHDVIVDNEKRQEASSQPLRKND